MVKSKITNTLTGGATLKCDPSDSVPPIKVIISEKKLTSEMIVYMNLHAHDVCYLLSCVYRHKVIYLTTVAAFSNRKSKYNMRKFLL